MERVTNNLIRNDFLYTIQRQQNEMEKVNNEIASQKKKILPEDDPAAVSEILFQNSRFRDIERYQRNIDFSKGKLDLTEAKISSLTDLLHRAKELAVQGANDVLTKEERQKIGLEINQILEEMVQIANSKYKGESLFAGTRTQEEAFQIKYGKLINERTGEIEWGQEMITQIVYQGDIGKSYAEVGRGEYIAVNLPGNHVFWAENHSIVSGTPGNGYIAQRDQLIRIDGVEIQIKAGDNLRTVADKINAAHINVRAEIDNTTGQSLFILRTTTPHQMWLEDLNGGTVLQDLGILANAKGQPPYNYSNSAVISGRSIFDVMINLRDSLFKGSGEEINAAIGGIDTSLSNILNYTATVGSIQKRMENTEKRLETQKVYAQEVLSKIQGLDMAEALTRLKNLETEYNAALQIGARIMPKTLLDYLR